MLNQEQNIFSVTYLINKKINIISQTSIFLKEHILIQEKENKNMCPLLFLYDKHIFH